MRRGDHFWIHKPELIIDGNLARKDICSNDEFRKFIWLSVKDERKRLEELCGENGKQSAWTESSGINTLYFLPNGRHVLCNDDVLHGSCNLYYESREDCMAYDYIKWHDARRAAGKPVLAPDEAINANSGHAYVDMAVGDLVHEFGY